MPECTEVHDYPRQTFQASLQRISAPRPRPGRGRQKNPARHRCAARLVAFLTTPLAPYLRDTLARPTSPPTPERVESSSPTASTQRFARCATKPVPSLTGHFSFGTLELSSFTELIRPASMAPRRRSRVKLHRDLTISYVNTRVPKSRLQ
jgi:hypothetical protein